jgi:hypothetical protein
LATLAALALILPQAAYSATHGLRIKEGPITIVEVWETTVLGQIQVVEGLETANLTVFVLDHDSIPSQPGGVGDSIGGVPANSGLVTIRKAGLYGFVIESISNFGPTTFMLQQYLGGALVYTTPSIDLQILKHDQDGNGLIIRRGSTTLVEVWEGNVIGELNAIQGHDGGSLNVYFLDPDSVAFIPDTASFQLEVELEDPAIATIDSLAVWWFGVNGNQVGETAVSFGIFHKEDGHSHYHSASIPISVVACACSCLADPACDGITNAQDVVATVNVAFRGAQSTRDGDCPYERTDVDCSGFTNAQDVIKTVNVVFRGSDPSTAYSDGCAH